jgi:hypothetical protein
MPLRCPVCPKPLEVGQPIFQLARGRYFGPAITPTYRDHWAVLGEWHETCIRKCPKISFHDGRGDKEFDIEIKAQEQPYNCSLCGYEIECKEWVFYGVIGRKPREPWFRPERRGYDVEFIAHDDCIKRPEVDPVTQALMRSRKWDGR